MKRTPFNDNWEFARDDAPFAPVVVPHDAMLGNRRDADAPAGSASGYYHGARYRYRKRFVLAAEQAKGAVLLEFEGVYRDARIAVNGCAVENVPPYGFVPFFVDVSALVHAGDNVVEVEADASAQPDCRWYPGGGLHRPVWLWTGGEQRVLPEGVRVTTTSLAPPTVHVSVASTGGTPRVSIVDATGAVVAQGIGAELDLEIPRAKLWSADSPMLYRCRVELLTKPAGPVPSEPAEPKESNPSDSVSRFGVITGIVSERQAPTVLDCAEATFGIRQIEWGPRGLFVNGRETLLRGGCIHCDNGIIGAASWSESERRRIGLLKRAGFNAVRIAHNPAPAALLDACDELGMYVMDEAWDQWFMRKNAHDYARHFLEWCDHDLHRLVARDYNHPSVIMYSIGNEIADAITPAGIELERSMVDLVHALDESRPVTCGFNLTMMVMEKMGQGWYAQHEGDTETSLVMQEDEPPRASLLFNLTAQALGTGMTMAANLPGADALVSPALDALDIAGYNYAQARYKADARKHPSRVVVGSETFPHELPRNWELVRSLPNVVGDFMWAGWDYLGEAGAGSWAYTAEEAGFSKPWPWLIAGSGALDILGQPNAHAALAAAVWSRDAGAVSAGQSTRPMIMVRPVNVMGGKTYKATWRGSDAIPSWSWRKCRGTEAQVEVYDGRAHSIRLLLNGREVATKRVRDFVARFNLEYKPGTLEAVALSASGREIGRDRLVSAQGALHLDACAETAGARAGDVAYVAVSIRGSNDEVEANADELVTLEVEGGVLLGFGSARPATTESFLAGAYTTYRGRALAVVHRATPGTVTVTARSATLDAASATIVFE